MPSLLQVKSVLPKSNLSVDLFISCNCLCATGLSVAVTRCRETIDIKTQLRQKHREEKKQQTNKQKRKTNKQTNNKKPTQTFGQKAFCFSFLSFFSIFLFLEHQELTWPHRHCKHSIKKFWLYCMFTPAIYNLQNRCFIFLCSDLEFFLEYWNTKHSSYEILIPVPYWPQLSLTYTHVWKQQQTKKLLKRLVSTFERVDDSRERTPTS